MLSRIFCVAAIITLLMEVASAQMPIPGISLSPDHKMTPEEKEKQESIEKAYKNAIGKIPDKKAPVDPWGGVRSNPSKPKQGQ